KRDHNGNAFAIGDLPAPNRLRIDQLLTSEYFGMNSTDDPQVDSLFQTYYVLLSKRRLTAAEKQQMIDLQMRLDGLQLLGRTRRERLLLEAADRFIARSDSEPHRQKRDKMRGDVLSQLDEMTDARLGGN